MDGGCTCDPEDQIYVTVTTWAHNTALRLSDNSVFTLQILIREWRGRIMEDDFKNHCLTVWND